MADQSKLYPHARFWNRIARSYATRPVQDQDAYEHKLKATRALLAPGMKVLEIGCGTGSTALLHAPFVARFDAIDFSPEMISIARHKAAEQSVENVTFAVSTLQDWAPKDLDGPYNAVLAMSVLHLVPDLCETLLQIRARLAPGGLFFSSTACLADMGWVTKYLLPVAGRLPFMPHLSSFSADTLQARMTEAGFTIESRWQPGPGAAVFLVARAK